MLKFLRKLLKRGEIFVLFQNLNSVYGSDPNDSSQTFYLLIAPIKYCYDLFSLILVG